MASRMFNASCTPCPVGKGEAFPAFFPTVELAGTRYLRSSFWGSFVSVLFL